MAMAKSTQADSVREDLNNNDFITDSDATVDLGEASTSAEWLNQLHSANTYGHDHTDDNGHENESQSKFTSPEYLLHRTTDKQTPQLRNIMTLTSPTLTTTTTPLTRPAFQQPRLSPPEPNPDPDLRTHPTPTPIPTPRTPPNPCPDKPRKWRP